MRAFAILLSIQSMKTHVTKQFGFLENNELQNPTF